MKFDAVQLMRVAEELLKYCYLKGARTVKLAYDFGEERSFCALSAKDLVLSPEDEAWLRKVFAGPVQPEVANYYGSLAGRRREEPQMELVATMAELEDLGSEPGLGTRIVVSRREAEFRSARV